MNRNWLEWLASIFYPCAHQWERLDTLKDDDENPNAIKIVRMCSICGTVDSVLISAPSKGHCPHRWRQVSTITVHPEGKPDAIPLGQVLVFECERCGETKSKKLTSQGFEEEPEPKKKTA